MAANITSPPPATRLRPAFGDSWSLMSNQVTTAAPAAIDGNSAWQGCNLIVSKLNSLALTTVPNAPDDKDPSRAYSAVFGTAELVAKIFGYVEYNDLYTGRRVCKAWNHVLTRNEQIQELAFKKAINKAPFTMLDLSGLGLQRFLDKHQNQFGDPSQLRVRPDGTVMYAWRRIVTERDFMNPFESAQYIWHNILNLQHFCVHGFCKQFSSAHRVVDPDYVNPVFRSGVDFQYTCLRVDGSKATFLAICMADIWGLLHLHVSTPKEATWRRTFLTNPPVRSFSAYSRHRGDKVTCDDGVTMDMVVQHLKEVFDGHETVLTRGARIRQELKQNR